MKRTILAAALLAGTAMTSPASADFIEVVQVLTPSSTAPFTIPFSGLVNGNPEPGLSASITYDLVSVNLASNQWTFDYSVSNTSSLTARLSTFGFNTDPNLQDPGVTRVLSGAVFNNVDSSNVPQHTQIAFCLTEGTQGNCAGGNSGGILSGVTTTGSFLLDFDGTATAATTITLADFYVRYQSIVGSEFGNSGIGLPVPVPGPIAGAGIPGLIVALGGMFGLNRCRRKRNGEVAA